MTEHIDSPQPTPETFPQPATQPARRHLHPALLMGAGFGAATVLAIGAIVGVHAVSAGAATAASSSSDVQNTSPQGPSAGFPGYGSGSSGSGSSGSGSRGSGSDSSGSGTGSGGSGTGSGGYGSGSDGGYGYGGGDGDSSGSQSDAVTGTAATSAQSRGVVLINTTVDYGSAEAAGTGMVLSSNGEILTNNHVVEGATKITVEIASTGAKYTASVVGTDVTDDVAVLRLANASGLSTANFDDSGSVGTGDSVTGVGNAEGQGSLAAASGSVTGVNQSLTTQAEQGASSESLTGMIETNAAIQSGDSGGPLYASTGKVVGMDTAASSTGADSFAIPITTALSVADKITSGESGSGIQLGNPAFLGVEVAASDSQSFGDGYGDTQASGATVSGVIDGTPAASAGLEQGDVITAVDGTAVTSTDLSSTLSQHKPGDSVTITWTDASGQSQSAPVTLASGPAA